MGQRRVVDWARANPLSSLRHLARIQGMGLLLGVVACASLAQGTLYTTWVLYTTFKFGWGPSENGWSLFAVGIVSAGVQGLLLGRLLKHFSAQQIAMWGLLSSAIAFVLWGLVTKGWMMYPVILANLLGAAVGATLQSLVSSAAGVDNQGQTMGALSGLSSLMAVIAPAFGAPLLGLVSHLPAGDWRIGAPMYFCAALQTLALWLAVKHFRGKPRPHIPTAPAAP